MYHLPIFFSVFMTSLMTTARSSSSFTEVLMTCNYLWVVSLAKKERVFVNLLATIMLNICKVHISWSIYSKPQYFQFLNQYKTWILKNFPFQMIIFCAPESKGVRKKIFLANMPTYIRISHSCLNIDIKNPCCWAQLLGLTLSSLTRYKVRASHNTMGKEVI